MKGKRIFVSGGAGVIGQAMIPRLVARGNIVMVGDLKPRPATFHTNVIYRQGDLNFLEAWELNDFKPEIFIHLAATFERAEETFEFWDENFWHNIRLSHHLMTLFKEQKTLKRVVFASSYLIYNKELCQFNEPQTAPTRFKETDPVDPRNLIGIAKFTHEIELRFLNHFCREQFSIVTARIYRGYGKNSRDVISRWIRSLLRNEPIEVYRPEGIFDYIYAEDSAEGLIRLAENLSVEGIINLGTGKSRRVQDIIDILKTYFPNMQITEAASDIPFEASEADMTYYGKMINWLPEYTLEKSIPEIIAYEQERLASLQNGVVYNPPILLITSASAKIPLLQKAKVAVENIHTDGRIIAGDASNRIVSAFLGFPFWNMPRTIAQNITAIIQGCKERQINMILPTRDGELLFWAENKKKFAENGIEVLVSTVDVVETCLDKLKFTQFGQANHLPMIQTTEDIALIQVERFVVKERYGAGSRKIGIDLSFDEAKAHASTLEKPIFQPYIEGSEISADAWLSEAGIVKGIVLRHRDLVVNGESQITTTFEDEAIEKQIRQILEKLKVTGCVVLQAIIDEDNNLHVIECNARIGGASTLSMTAGLDSLYWSILQAQKQNIDTIPFVRRKKPIRQIRIPTDTYTDDFDI